MMSTLAQQLIVATLIVTTTVGCSAAVPGGTPTLDPLAQLQSLPSIDQAVATYSAMEVEIRAAIVGAAPTVQWVVEQPEPNSGCSKPFDNLGGRTVTLLSHGTNTPIPDEAWPATLAAAETIARRHGFNQTFMKVDQPGNHQARFTNTTDGAYSDLGTLADVVLQTYTGCHLPK